MPGHREHFLRLPANVALLGLTHKDVFGHYVGPLLPFYFVAFAHAGQWVRLKGGVRPLFVWGVVIVVCIGGIDAALWVSQTMAARNGLLTMRRVIAAVEKDRPNANRVGLSFGFRNESRASLEGYNVIASLDTKRQFALRPGQSVPADVQGGSAALGGKVLMDEGR